MDVPTIELPRWRPFVSVERSWTNHVRLLSLARPSAPGRRLWRHRHERTTLKECLRATGTDREIIGVLSLIIWSLVTLVSIKYLAIIMRADNHGEGGILALLSLAFPKGAKSGGMAASGMMMVGIAGAALLYGDGVITPAISVLSAVEGLKLATEQVRPFIIPITLGVLIGLFAVQRKGTGAIGKWFAR